MLQALSGASGDSLTLARVRWWLLVVLSLGLGGSTLELWLMGHHEDAWQWLPLAVMSAGLASAGWVMWAWSDRAIRVFRTMMGALAVTGAVGAALHYGANREFQLEMDPSLQGWALLAEVLHAKAPPALAPGNMLLLSLIGFIAVWSRGSSGRHAR